MVARGDVYWANVGGSYGRRPVCVITRDSAIPVMTSLTCAPVTRTIRGVQSEVRLDRDQGLPDECVISCDNLLTIPITAFDPSPVGSLDEVHRARLDRALRYALDIRY